MGMIRSLPYPDALAKAWSHLLQYSLRCPEVKAHLSTGCDRLNERSVLYYQKLIHGGSAQEEFAAISREFGVRMRNLLILFVVLMVYGCTSMTSQNVVLRHEQDESRLLTEKEFMARVSQSATLIYVGMNAISDAAKLYALDHDGILPPGNMKNIKAQFLDGGYLKAWPMIPPFAFAEPVQSEFFYVNGYANMDNVGAHDDVIFVSDLKIEVCEEFNRRYSSSAKEDLIYDYEANKDRYPGEAIGRHVKIYAISWARSEKPDYCDIEWVMQ